MKYIAPIAMAAIVILLWVGAVPDASVGGPMTIAFAYFIAALVVAFYEAWLQKRALGWIVNIPVAVIGGFIAASIGTTVLQPLILLFPFQGSLMSSGHPLLYIMAAAIMLITLLGAWFSLQLINRWR